MSNLTNNQLMGFPTHPYQPSSLWTDFPNSLTYSENPFPSPTSPYFLNRVWISGQICGSGLESDWSGEAVSAPGPRRLRGGVPDVAHREHQSLLTTRPACTENGSLGPGHHCRRTKMAPEAAELPSGPLPPDELDSAPRGKGYGQAADGGGSGRFRGLQLNCEG